MIAGGPGDPGSVLPPAAPRPRSGQRASPRSIATAVISTVVVFVLLALVVVNSPGWERVQKEFFDAENFGRSAPGIIAKFAVNVRLFLIAEVLILVFGLVVAVLRSIPGPAFFPIRLLATIYVDVFRAVPGVLVIYMLGFGIPGLQIAGIPNDPFFWAVVALTLLYSAYVSEVYRAGIESIHPSQAAAARSLGLSQFQALRYVVVPQAVRRVIPPLLNDFIGLQKDSALVGVLGYVEGLKQAQIVSAATFDFTPYVALALVYIVITIPEARFVDWLVARDQRRRQAAGGV